MIQKCRNCSLGTGDNWCPGHGPDSSGMPFVIGLNPGVQEARAKRPFTGPSSRIRDHLPPVYYTNLIKCTGDFRKCKHCRFLDVEINNIQPRKLVLLGSFVSMRLTGLLFRPGLICNIPTIYGYVPAFMTWHPSPANNAHWNKLVVQCKTITKWLEEP